MVGRLAFRRCRRAVAGRRPASWPGSRGGGLLNHDPTPVVGAGLNTVRSGYRQRDGVRTATGTTTRSPGSSGQWAANVNSQTRSAFRMLHTLVRQAVGADRYSLLRSVPTSAGLGSGAGGHRPGDAGSGGRSRHCAGTSSPNQPRRRFAISMTRPTNDAGRRPNQRWPEMFAADLGLGTRAAGLTRTVEEICGDGWKTPESRCRAGSSQSALANYQIGKPRQPHWPDEPR